MTDRYSKQVAAWRLEVQQANAARATAEAPTATIVGVIEARANRFDAQPLYRASIEARAGLAKAPSDEELWEDTPPALEGLVGLDVADVAKICSDEDLQRAAAGVDVIAERLANIARLAALESTLRSLLAHHKRSGYAKPEEQQAWQDAERLVGR